MGSSDAGLGLLGISSAFEAAVFDALPDLVLAFDSARSTRPVVWSNAALIAAIGRNPVGEPLGSVLGGGAADVMDRAVRTRIGRASIGQSTLAFPGGHAERTLDTKVVRVGSDIVVWLATDRTAERAISRRHSDRLAARNDELQRSNFDLGQFALVAAHDLMEPLRMVTAYLDLLGELYGDRLDETGHQYLGFAVDGADRMRSLINALLALARVNGSAPPTDSVDLARVLADAADTVTIPLAESGAIQAPATLPTVRGDRGQLVQLFVNVLANAVKFSPDGPQITVSAAPDARAGLARISIADAGIGIAADKREAVFEMFRRLNPRTRYAGSGMGLAICKAIVDRHGGDIGVDAAPGGGTVVWFTLPIAPAIQNCNEGDHQ